MTEVEVGADRRRHPDVVVVEEPMEIRLDGVLATTTMRTPGHDFELACGWCHTAGLLGSVPVTGVRYCATGGAAETDFNVVTVETAGAAPQPEPMLATSSSSCGVCGTIDLDRLTADLGPVTRVDVEPLVLADVPRRMAGRQPLFEATGAAHAAGTFTPAGSPAVVREDIGRHNAVDKVVGRLLLDGALPATGLGLFVSGRASFEMVQKAWAGGFGCVLAVSAPSALAIETARRAGIALAGFVRGGRVNLYT